MIKQFIVTLMNLGGVREQTINCSNEDSAKNIAIGLFGGSMRIINIREV